MKEIFREVASLAIYNPITNKFLVQDRTSISKYGEEVTFFGWWLDEGESPIQAAQRESQEELGIKFNEYIYLGTFTHDMWWKNYIRNLFLIITNIKNFNDMEGDGAIWLTLEEAEKKRFTTDIKWEFSSIKKYIQLS